MKTGGERTQLLDMLQRMPVFGGVADKALQHILDRASAVIAQKGECFFHEGDRAQSMFVLVEGRVTVVKTVGGSEYELSRMVPGDCFGELELIDLCPRAASVRALQNSLAIEISATVLHEVYRIDETSFAIMHMNMGREVSRRLRKLDGDLLKVRTQASCTRGQNTSMETDLPGGTPARTKRCKVCTKHIQPDEEHWDVWHGDAKYVVCCPICADHFRKNPELYLVT